MAGWWGLVMPPSKVEVPRAWSRLSSAVSRTSNGDLCKSHKRLESINRDSGSGVSLLVTSGSRLE